MRRTFPVVVAVCVSLAFSADAKVKIVNASPRMVKTDAAAATLKAEVSREKWVATKAILRDAKTGALRKPTEAETLELVRTLRELTARSTSAPRRVIAANGETQALADEGVAQVLIARATADGQNETLCVQTFEEAADFLGLQRAGSEQ